MRFDKQTVSTCCDFYFVTRAMRFLLVDYMSAADLVITNVDPVP